MNVNKKIFYILLVFTIFLVLNSVSASNNVSDIISVDNNSDIISDDNNIVDSKISMSDDGNEEVSPTYIIKGESSFYKVFRQDGLSNSIISGSTLDLQGGFHLKGCKVNINKPINIISSTHNAVIHDAADFCISTEGSGTNVNGIKFVNSVLCVKKASNVTIQNINMTADKQGVGFQTGVMSIQADSKFVNVKNSYFENRDTGSSLVVIGFSDNCIIENNEIVLGRGCGNGIYITTFCPFNYNGHPPKGNIIKTNRIKCSNPSAICIPIVVAGSDNLVDENIIDYNGYYGISSQYSTVSMKNNITNNVLTGGCIISVGKDSYMYNNSVNGILTPNSFVKNTVRLSLLSIPSVDSNIIAEGYIPFNNHRYTTNDLIYHINDENYKNFFDRKGNMNSIISANSTLLIGNITNKILLIDKKLSILSDENSIIINSTITFIKGSDNSIIKGLTFNNIKFSAIEVIDVSNISILTNNITILPGNNITGVGIFANVTKHLNISSNIVSYTGKTNGTNAVIAMHIFKSEDTIIKDNKFNIEIPSCTVKWSDVKTTLSEGIRIDSSNNILFNKNSIFLNGTDVIGYFDTIYVMDVTRSNNVQIANNKIKGVGHKYIYGLTISGKDFIIINNTIIIESDTNYTNGINIEPNSTGIIENNVLSLLSPYIIYAIYEDRDYLNGIYSNVSYINNYIYADSHAVYGMYIIGDESNITGNIIVLNGNYTLGILSQMKGISIIANNQITVNGLKKDSAKVIDINPIQTVGILPMSGSRIINNKIIVQNKCLFIKQMYYLAKILKNSTITNNLLYVGDVFMKKV